MPIFIGADHRGFEMKNQIVDWLKQKGAAYQDLGAFKYEATDDYNDVAIKLSMNVLQNPGSIGILVCGSSQGMVMQANRLSGIRAVDCYDEMQARLAKEHHDANIACLPADFLKIDQATRVLDTFFFTKFTEQPRYIRRIQKLDMV